MIKYASLIILLFLGLSLTTKSILDKFIDSATMKAHGSIDINAILFEEMENVHDEKSEKSHYVCLNKINAPQKVNALESNLAKNAIHLAYIDHSSNEICYLVFATRSILQNISAK